MTQQRSSDASFFSLVHHMVETEKEQSPLDRRLDGRMGVRAVQFVAPYRDGKLPVKGDFFRVIGNDLSGTGFSYLAAHSPDCEYLVVALGQYPHVYLAAQVMHSTTVEIENRPLLLIGCRFVARLRDLEIGPLSAVRRDDPPTEQA